MMKNRPRKGAGFLKKARELQTVLSDHSILQTWRMHRLLNWSNAGAVMLNVVVGSAALIPLTLPPLLSVGLIVAWVITTIISVLGVLIEDPLRKVVDIKFMTELRDDLNRRHIPVKLDRRVAQQAAVELSLIQLNELVGKNHVGSLTEKIDQLLSPLTGNPESTLGIENDICSYTVYCYNATEGKFQAIWKEWDDEIKHIDKEWCSKEHNIAGTACWVDAIDIQEDSSNKPHEKLFTGSSTEKAAQRKYWRSYIAIPLSCKHLHEKAPRFPVVFVLTSSTKGRFSAADFDGVARNYRQILNIYFSRLPDTAWPHGKAQASN